MADKIGSLIVDLSANVARFDSDLKRATSIAEGAMQKIQSSISSAMSAFGALGAGLSVAGFAAMAKQTIDAAAALDDLSEKTGASVESLSKFAGVARITGQDMGSVEQAMGKLSKSINEAQDGTSDAARAFAAFGVSIKNSDGSLKNSGTLMAELAVAQQKFGDGAGKAAAFMQLLGKSGAEVIPFMNDYVRLSDQVSETTAEQAAQAETLKIELGLLAERFNALLRESILPLIPQLRALVGEVVALGKTIGEAMPKSNPFAGFLDSLRDTIQRTSGEIAYLQKIWQNAKEMFKGGIWAGLTSDADLSAGAGAAYDAAYLKAQNESLAQSARDLPPLLEAVARSANKTDVAFGKVATGAKRAADAFKALLSASNEYAREQELLAKIALKNAEALELQRKAIADGYTAMANSIGAAEDMIRSYEDQADAIGKTKEALADLEIQRAAEIRDMRLMAGMGDDAVALYDKQVAAIRRRLSVQTTEDAKQAAQNIADEFTRQSDSITQSLTDALLRGFESGKDFAENFVATLKNMFSTLILRPIIQAIVAPVAGGLAGLVPGVASAGGLGGLGGGLGGLSGIGNWISGIGGGGGGFFGGLGGGITNIGVEGLFGGTLGNLSGGFAALGAGNIMGGLGSLAASALPVLGIGLLLYSMFKTPRGGPKTGGEAGRIPGLEDFFTPNQNDTTIQQAIDSVETSYERFLNQVGGRGTALFQLGYDTDPEGTASDRVRAGVSVNGRLLYDTGNIETGRDNAATQARLELEAKRALLAALQASDLPEDIARLIDSIDPGTATAEAIDNILGVASAFSSLSEVFNGDVLQDGLDAYENSLLGVNLALGNSIESVYELAADFDGTADAATNLATATQGIYAAAVQAVAQINVMRRELSALFSTSATSYRLAGMDNAGQRTYLTNLIADATSQLSTATDINVINQLARDINAYQSQLFNLLTPEEQVASAGSFASAAEAAGTLVDQRLADALTGIDASITTMITEVQAVFLAAGTTLQESATVIASAGATNQTAAGTQLDAAIIQRQRADVPLKIIVSDERIEVR